MSNKSNVFLQYHLYSMDGVRTGCQYIYESHYLIFYNCWPMLRFWNRSASLFVLALPLLTLQLTVRLSMSIQRKSIFLPFLISVSLSIPIPFQHSFCTNHSICVRFVSIQFSNFMCMCSGAFCHERKKKRIIFIVKIYWIVFPHRSWAVNFSLMSIYSDFTLHFPQ